MVRQSPLVMVVDDDLDFLEICRHVLQTGGYRVVCVADPDEALRQMAAEKPDLVISDLMMKTLDAGFLFVKQVRDDARFRNLPVIIITGVASQRGYDFEPRTAEDLSAMRVNAFLAKPATPDKLLAKVRELIGS
jgi:chemosensory pili system protein ChpA (sensor histidine kinase/response regulator)